MDTKMEHGLSYKELGVEDFFEKSPSVRYLVKKYHDAVGDKYTVDQIMDLMHITIGKQTFFLFLVEMHGEPIGLMTAHAISHDDAKLGGMVHIGYLDPAVTKEQSKEIFAGAMQLLDEWAERNEMGSIFMQTGRNEHAFDRMIGQFGFKRITTVYEKELNHGETKASTASDPAVRPAEARV